MLYLGSSEPGYEVGTISLGFNEGWGPVPKYVARVQPQLIFDIIFLQKY